MRRACLVAIPLVFLPALLGRWLPAGQPAKPPEIDVHTFSIVAYDPEREEWGVGVASKYLAVGSAVPFAKAGIGAVATQAAVRVTWGPEALELLAKGSSAEETIKTLTEADKRSEVRQIGIVDAKGNATSFTGAKCIAYAGH